MSESGGAVSKKAKVYSLEKTKINARVSS